jgi:Protein of unknown function (DUF2917)
MSEKSSQFDCSEMSAGHSLDDGPALRAVIYVTLAPKGVAAWRMRTHTELRAHSSEVWLTREGHLDDYWLRSGDVVLLKRGERIWLSTDGDAAQITFACQYINPRRGLRRWLGRVRFWFSGGLPIGA